jgi:hypothetical protein
MPGPFLKHLSILKPKTMKNNLQTNPVALKVIILITCFMLVMLYNKSKAGSLTASAYKKITASCKIDVAKK